MTKNKITRVRKGTGFAYYQREAVVADKETIEWIKSLVIPPAWNDVVISNNHHDKVLAQGIDAAGRTQAIYHPSFRKKQDKKKYSKVLSFASKLPALRQQIERDLAKRDLPKEKVLACVVKLIDLAYFRVGNEEYAKENSSYGITTMRSKHVDVNSYSVTFDFMGKSGKHHVKKIADRTLSKIIKQLDEMPGYEIFRYTDEAGGLHNISSGDVNGYIKEHMGDDFTAKDFRTWGGTLLAVDVLSAAERVNNRGEREKVVTECVKQVSERLGNTPAIAKASYIDPSVFERYLKGEDFNKVRQTLSRMKDTKYVSEDERCALKILEANV
jgi:DNA topoisomerase-1